MIKMSFHGHKETDHPKEFTVYSESELRDMLVKNSWIINNCQRDPHQFIVARINSMDRVKILFALLIREAFEEATECATFRPSNRLMFIHFAPKLNWVPNIKGKVIELVHRVSTMPVSGLEKPKDRWGELLIAGHFGKRV